MNKGLLAAGAAVVYGLGAIGLAPSAGAQVGCETFTVTDNTNIYAPGNNNNLTAGPWIPVSVSAGSTVALSVTTYDPTHDTHPIENQLQTNEIIVIEMKLADGSIVRTGPTGDIPDGVTSAGPFDLGQYGPLASDLVEIRQVHGAIFSGPTENFQSVHGIDLVVSCVEVPPATTTTAPPTTTSTTVPEETTTTVPETTTTTAPETTTTTEGPSTTVAPTSTSTPEHVPTLPVTGPSTTTGLALLGVGFVTFGAALITSARDRRGVLS
jgi:hypothetical protein